MCANSDGSGMTAQMRRFTWAFAGRLCDKYHNLMSWFILEYTHKLSLSMSKLTKWNMRPGKTQISLCVHMCSVIRYFAWHKMGCKGTKYKESYCSHPWSSVSMFAFPWHCVKSFMFKLFKSSCFDNQSSGSIHILTIGTLEGLLSFLTPGSMPRDGARGQNLGHL